MNTSDFIAIFVLTIPTVSVVSYVVGYYRGAVALKQIGLDAINRLHKEHLRSIRKHFPS